MRKINKKGSGSIETAIALIISVVLGGIVLMGFTGIIDTTVYNKLDNGFNKKTVSSPEYVNFQEFDQNNIVDEDIGDCNMDGVSFTKEDYIYLQRGLSGWNGYELHPKLCDIDSNGTIDANDLEFLKNRIGG